jgi:hypothetical protein
MKTTSLLLSLLYATAVSANIGFGLSVGGNTQEPTPSTDDDDLKVPGQNPLFYCAKPEGDILTIEEVDLDPNPPAAYASILASPLLISHI